MKNMKKILALVVAVLMIVASVSVAMADAAITINGAKGNLTAEDQGKHTYKVYQIFTGDLIDGKLSNVKYGQNYGTTGSSVPKTELDAIGTTEANAKQFAIDVMASAKFHGDNPVATLTGTSMTTETLPTGYYLIVDDTAQTLTDGDAFSRYMVKVLDQAITVTVKKDVPSSDKEISADGLGIEDIIARAAGTKTNNVSIGDKVNYTLKATIPASAIDYTKGYYFILNDNLSTGLTIDYDSIKVYKDEVGEGKELAAESYKLYTGQDASDKTNYADGHTFQVAVLGANTEALAGKTIYVTYTATLNKDAFLFDVANPNEYDVKYSNQPYYDYNGDKDDDTPGKPDSSQQTPTGNTPKSRTETFSTALKVKKVDQDGMSLKGATFKIEGKSLQTVVTYTEEFTKDSTGEYWLLKNGSYTKDAPVENDSMTEAVAGAEAGYVVCDENDTATGKIQVGGQWYRPYVKGTDTGKVYILNKKNTDLYQSTTDKYKITETKVYEGKGGTKTGEGENATMVSETITVGDDGILKFDGLGAGSYTITEVKAPDGYTPLDKPITVEITFNPTPAEGASHWTATANAPKDDDGYFTVTVVNRAGNTLPETGGMGTTILYIGGSILVILAAILLITKRRMNAED